MEKLEKEDVVRKNMKNKKELELLIADRAK